MQMMKMWPQRFTGEDLRQHQKGGPRHVYGAPGKVLSTWLPKKNTIEYYIHLHTKPIVFMVFICKTDQKSIVFLRISNNKGEVGVYLYVND